MSKIISVNCGSSSLKFQLFEMPSEEVLTSGLAERIGLEQGVFSIKVNGEKHTKELPIHNHTEAVQLLLTALVEYGVVSSLDEITAAGHRVVQGGTMFPTSIKVTDAIAKDVEDLGELAPLHNPANLIGYEAFKDALPKIDHVFVFDTAFHQTMEPDSYLFPVPYNWYTDYKVRRYGAHGTSHQFVANRVIELLNKEAKDTRIVTCHLGNGASITACLGGKSINTSMGFTPLGGIMMGTRSGDIDPAIIPYMKGKLNKSAQEVIDILNKESGMLGVSGLSSDARDIEEAIKEGNQQAILTRELYVNRIINVIGGYVFQLGGVDAIVFTAGLGENDVSIRAEILRKIEKVLELSIDYQLNNKSRGKEVCVSTEISKVQVWVIPTNEELVIARDTVSVLGL